MATQRRRSFLSPNINLVIFLQFLKNNNICLISEIITSLLFLKYLNIKKVYDERLI